MKTLIFNSNIKCNGCIAKVGPVLDQLAGANNWKVDLEDQNKTLSVNSETISMEIIQEALQKVGYSISEIK